MIVFPDQRVAGKHSIPYLTVGVVVLLAGVTLAVSQGALSLAIPGLPLMALSILFLFGIGGPMEFALGRMIYALALMISGLVAVGLPMSLSGIEPDGLSWVPMAVAALSGLAAGLFRSWRIRPLYLIPGLIGSLKIPAFVPVLIWLAAHTGLSWQDGGLGAPFWIQLQSAGAGLVVGVAMNALSLIQPSMFTAEYTGRVIRKGLQEAEEMMQEHKLKPARRLISRLASLDPDNMEVKRVRYAVWKYHPKDAEFHNAAAALLDQHDTDADTNEMVGDIFRDYMAVTQGKPDLPVDLHLALARRFARSHNVEDAAHIVNVYLQRNLQHPRLPEAILTLAEGYVLTDRPAKAAHYADTLIALFPETKEALSAKNMLDRLSKLLS